MRGTGRMRSVKADKQVSYLDSKKVTPQDIMTVLKDEREYEVKIKRDDGRQHIRITKGRAMAFMGYINGKWEVPYGDVKIVDEVVEKIKDR
jgi:hypothetical protein